MLGILLGVFFTLSALAESPQETLVNLEIQEALLKTMYRAKHPALQDVQAEIKALKATPEIEDDKYWELLGDKLVLLQAERESLAKKLRKKHPDLKALDAQIAFAGQKLRQKPAAQAAPTP